MRFSFLLVASAATFVAAAPHQKRYTGDPTPGTDKLAIQGLVNLAKHEFTSGSIPTCNVWNSNKRVEWNTFSNSQKTAYINAVLCLQSQPAQSDPAFCPGCKSRYDDFVATVSSSHTLNVVAWTLVADIPAAYQPDALHPRHRQLSFMAQVLHLGL